MRVIMSARRLPSSTHPNPPTPTPLRITRYAFQNHVPQPPSFRIHACLSISPTRPQTPKFTRTPKFTQPTRPPALCKRPTLAPYFYLNELVLPAPTSSSSTPSLSACSCSTLACSAATCCLNSEAAADLALAIRPFISCVCACVCKWTRGSGRVVRDPQPP